MSGIFRNGIAAHCLPAAFGKKTYGQIILLVRLNRIPLFATQSHSLLSIPLFHCQSHFSIINPTVRLSIPLFVVHNHDPTTTILVITCVKSPYVAYGNEAMIEYGYRNVCLFRPRGSK